MIDQRLFESIEQMARQIDAQNQKKGFNDGFSLDRALLLVHSELSEAVEELRNGHTETEIYLSEKGKPEGFPVEIADALIRLLHICARCEIPIGQVMQQKDAYNDTRTYKHGKKF